MAKEEAIVPRIIQGRPALTLQQACGVLGVSYTSFMSILRRNNIERFKLGYGLEKYVWKDDIDRLQTPRPVEEE